MFCLLIQVSISSPPPEALHALPVLSTCEEVRCWVDLRFTSGSNVAAGASIIQLARTKEARLAPQLPRSRQIRQRTKLFMVEELKDGGGLKFNVSR